MGTDVQLNRPSAITVSLGADYDGSYLPSTVYIAEAGNNVGRKVALNYYSYLGVVNTFIGTGSPGWKATGKGGATNTMVDQPTGIVSDGSILARRL